MQRIKFLTEFLGALGAINIDWNLVNDNYIRGRVWYEPSPHLPYYDPIEDDTQEFCWHGSESNAPSLEALTLAKLIRENKLLDIDKLIISKVALKQRYKSEYVGLDFDKGYEELLSIEVPMIDENQETDIFFIHE